MPRRIFLHRAMWRMYAKKIHLLLGSLIALGVGLLIVFYPTYFWRMQTFVVSKLLSFANVPHALFNLGEAVSLKEGIPLYYYPGGLTFQIPLTYQYLSPFTAFIISGILIVGGLLLYRTNIISLPFKVLSFALIALIVITLLYVSLVSPIPPHILHRLTIDWQFSGIIILVLIALIFAWAVFPVKGPLWIKLFWLVAVLAFSIIWNTTRLSVVLATLYHLGSLPFILLHYLAGIYIDFIYIVAFYSLALAHLARHEVSEVGW